MRGGEIFPPAQEFGKRSDVSRILMPTAPTRIKPRPHTRWYHLSKGLSENKNRQILS